MNDREVATYLLYEGANKVLNFETLHPRDIVEVVKDFLYDGCKTRKDYELMVRYIFVDDGFNRELLLSL